MTLSICDYSWCWGLLREGWKRHPFGELRQRRAKRYSGQPGGSAGTEAQPE
ncbi:hypothetical protein [Chryseobacterium salipaludis]|uniref:hypothetical protein n=1 Tax=Planobacterium sp. JC490 TaxID=2994550 RepID=UPI00224DB187|nr:hypothetical protein [Planobacterium sp. JC490]